MKKNYLKEVINKCYLQKKALLHFNINNFSQLHTFLLLAKNKRFFSLIIAVCHDVINDFFTLDLIWYHFSFYKKKWNLKNVFLHLDHCRDFDFCKKAINLNFDSVMFDGSQLSISENVSKSYILKQMTLQKNILLEVEVGAIDIQKNTDIEDVKMMCEKVNPDLLAISFGNYHGLNKKKTLFDWKLLKIINTQFNVPLVLHGGSGLQKKILKKAISNGIVKINFDTILQKKYFINDKINEFKLSIWEKKARKNLFLFCEKILNFLCQ